jgi:restriction system protein
MTAVMLAAAKAPNVASPALHGLLKGLLAVWPLWLLLGVIALAKLAYHLYRVRRLALSGIAQVDRMDGKIFEEFLGTLFHRLCYRVENTRYRGDYGADLVVAKDGFKTAVQAKRWNKRVGVNAVQEAVASKGYYRCHRALVVANRDFTQQAKRLARANGVEFWNRDVLVSKLLSVRSQEEGVAPRRQSLGDNGLMPTLVAPTSSEPARCVECGVAVSEKVRDYCLARPARFGGQVYCFKHQGAARPAVSPEQS